MLQSTAEAPTVAGHLEENTQAWKTCVGTWARYSLDCNLTAGVTNDREVNCDLVLTVGHHIIQPAAVGVHLQGSHKDIIRNLSC